MKHEVVTFASDLVLEHVRDRIVMLDDKNCNMILLMAKTGASEQKTKLIQTFIQQYQTVVNARVSQS